MEIPGYKIEHEIGKGGMATVYLALQEALERYVALKVLSPALTADSSYTERFLKERRIVARLNHTNIVTVFDSGVHNNSYYLAMEYLPGGTLEQRIEDGLDVAQALGVVKTILGALGYAHHEGFIHRDIKPLNILFREDETAVLTDFGIARLVDGGTQLTIPGTAIGSPHYMSPEQIRGQAVDSRADLYSVGIVFYRMLTGKLPYSADNLVALALMHTTAPIPVFPDEYSKFQPILSKLLAKEPENRFASAKEVIHALQTIENPSIGQDRTLTVTADNFPGLASPLPSTTGQQSLATAYIQQQTFETSQQDQTVATGPREGFTQPQQQPIPTEDSSAKKSKSGLIVGLSAAAAVVLLVAGYFVWVNILQSDKPVSQPEPVAQGLEAIGEYYSREAEKLRQQGALEESLQQIEKGLQAVPDYRRLVALREAVQGQLEAQRQAQAERERREQAARQALVQAQELQRQGALEESLRQIEQGLGEVPDQAELLALREAVQGQLEAQRQAQAERERREQAARQALVQAQELQRQGALEESLRQIEQGLGEVPDQAELLALREAVQGQLEAQRQAQAERERREQAARQALVQAQELQRQGALEESLRQIEQGLGEVPDQAELLALREAVQGQLEAQRQAQAERERREQAARQALVQAQELQRQGALEESLRQIEQGLGEVPDQAELLALREAVQGQLEAQRQVQAERERREQAARQALVQAQELQRQGALEESLRQIEQGLGEVPDQAELLALREAVQGQLEAQRQAQAERERRQLIATQALAQAKRLQQQGALEDSLTQIERGLDAVPDNPELLSLRQKVQAQRVELQRQLAEIQRKLEEQEALQRTADEAFVKAQQLRQQGQLEESLAAIQRGLESVSVHAGLNTLRTEVQTQLDELRSQQAEREQIMRQVNDALARAQQLQQKGALTESLEEIKQGLRLAPDHPDLRTLQTQVQAQLDATVEQERRQQQASQALAQAQRLQQQGLSNDSLAQIEQGLEAMPNHPELLAMRTEIRTQLQTQKKQEDRINELLELASQQLALNKLTVPKGDNALETYQQVLALDPDNVDAEKGFQLIGDQYETLAGRLLKNKSFDKSQTYIKRGLTVAPKHPGLLSLRDRVLEQLEQRRQQLEQKRIRQEKAREQARQLQQQRRQDQRQSEQRRLEQQRLEQQRLEQQRLEQQRLEQQRLEQQRLEQQRRLEEQQRERQRLEQLRQRQTQTTPPPAKEEEKPATRVFGTF